MSPSKRGTTTAVSNHLLALLPAADRQRLLDAGEAQALAESSVLFEQGDLASHVYFPSTGFVSLVVPVDGHPGLEVGMVGREGMVGAHVALGIIRSPVRALVQGSGVALRVGTQDFRALMARDADLQKCVHRYLYVLMAQLTTSASCLRFHSIGPRLARWLLMSQDRAGANTFPVTQEFLAYMLGVRRVGVTYAAGVLQREGLITYRRGQLTVLDRLGLEAAACSCYRADQRTYSDAL